MAARLAERITDHTTVVRKNLMNGGVGAVGGGRRGSLINKGGSVTPRLAWPVESNELFVVLDRSWADQLQGVSGLYFYEYKWFVGCKEDDNLAIDETREGLYRLVTSFATTAEEVDTFSEVLLADCNARG